MIEVLILLRLTMNVDWKLLIRMYKKNARYYQIENKKII